MHKEPNVLSNYLYNLSYKLLAILIPIITTPYISRVLKAEAIGAFSYTQSIVTFFSMFGIMGLDLYGQLQVSKTRNEKEILANIFGEIFIAKVITSLCSLIIYGAMTFFFKKYQFLLIVMGILLIANIFDISWLFQGLEEFKKIVIRNYIIKLLGLILILLFVKKEEDVYLYAFIIQSSTLLGNCSLWYHLKRYFNFTKINWRHVHIHIKNCLIYFLPTIATTIYTSTDKIMLGSIINSDYENGIYDQAHKIEQVIITVVSSISTVLLPRLSYLHSKNDKKELDKYIGNAIKITGFLTIPMMCGLIGISDIFIPIFLGSEFHECIGLIRIFSILLLFSGINSMLGDSCLVAQGKQGKYNIGVVLGAIANIILNAFLIPIYMSYGAAMASLVSEIIVFTVFIFFSHNEYISFLTIFKGWGKYFIAAVPMGGIVWLIGCFGTCNIITMIIQLFAGITVYGFLLIMLKDKSIIFLLTSGRRAKHNIP